MTTSSALPLQGDHAGWAAHWGEVCVRSLRLLEAGASTDETEEALHAVRTARQAWYHWMRLRPANRPPAGHERMRFLTVTGGRRR